MSIYNYKLENIYYVMISERSVSNVRYTIRLHFVNCIYIYIYIFLIDVTVYIKLTP
jgi:hypothetical protein